jgi:hypothetical protein
VLALLSVRVLAQDMADGGEEEVHAADGQMQQQQQQQQQNMDVDQKKS